jgi:uncharacterized membrane protein
MTWILWLVVIGLVLVVRRQWLELERLQRDVHRLQQLQDAQELLAAPSEERPTGSPASGASTAARAPGHVAAPRVPTAPAAPRAAAAPPRLPSPQPFAKAASARERPEGPRRSLETFVGGRLLLVAGVVVVLFGLAFFLKYAVDRGWIGPGLRIGMGVAAGVAALLSGDRLRARGLDVYGHALMGGGLGALYLSNYFAAVRYGFLDRPAAHLLVAAITALGVGLAIVRGAKLLAYLGFLGGYLAPALLARDVDALGQLGGWLAVLHLGLLCVLWARPWPGLDLMALLATLLYYATWRTRWLTDGRVDAALLFVLSMAVCLLLLGLLPALARRRRLSESALMTALFTGLLGLLAAHELLYPERRPALGAGALALAGAYFCCARVAARHADVGAGAAGAAGAAPQGRDAPGAHDATVLTVFGLAALAAAVPALLRGLAIAPMWAAAGTATVFLGARRRLTAIEACGAAMLVLSAWDLLAHRLPVHPEAYAPFVNGRFLAFAAPCVALVACAAALQREGRQRLGAGVLLTLGVWAFTPLLANELWARYGLLPGPERDGAAREAATALQALALAAWVALLGRAVRGRGSLGVGFGFVLLLVPLAGALLAGLVLATDGHRLDFVPIVNRIFLAGVTVATAVAAAAACLRGRPAVAVLWAAVGYGLVLLAAEFIAHAGLRGVGAEERLDARLLAQVCVSVAWATYASALLVAGFARRHAHLRWAGLGVFLITLAKVFLVDMAGLSAVYRIGSFLVLGLALVAASYLYQRARATG